MKNFTFSFPTQVIFGRDAETHAGALSAPFGPNVMLLYGSDRIRRSGLLGRLTADLEAHGLTVSRKTRTFPLRRKAGGWPRKKRSPCCWPWAAAV